MRAEIMRFAGDVQRATSRDEVAALLLDAAEQVLAAGLRAAAPPGASGLRCVVHFRPPTAASAYAGVFVREAGRAASTSPPAHESLRAPASLWRALERRPRPVMIDAGLGTWQPLDTPIETHAMETAGSLSTASRGGLADRRATHVFVLPLVHAGDLIGLLTLDALALDAVGECVAWPAFGEEAMLLCALAAAPLVALPAARVDPVAFDVLLPVVGAAFAPVVRMLAAFAAEEDTLLLHGETGVGKSRLVRFVHAHSPRANGPFEVLDLLGVPEETQLGELFGWRRGAFTGAVADHDGFVTRAFGGTLFLDEIDKLSLGTQAGLLGLLEDRRYRILGDRGPPRTADVRFIAGTNADLRRLVEQGRFREDLLYRLEVLPVHVPPLRARRDEIAGWADFMLARRQQERGRPERISLAPSALSTLLERPFPGNLRELDHLLRRASTLAGLGVAPGQPVTIGVEHLSLAGPPAPGQARPASVSAALAAALRGLVQKLELTALAEGDDALVSGGLLGLALAEAIAVTGGRDAAFRTLGLGELLRNRNHHRALRREVARAVSLLESIGEPLPPALAALRADEPPAPQGQP